MAAENSRCRGMDRMLAGIDSYVGALGDAGAGGRLATGTGVIVAALRWTCAAGPAGGAVVWAATLGNRHGRAGVRCGIGPFRDERRRRDGGLGQSGDGRRREGLRGDALDGLGVRAGPGG